MIECRAAGDGAAAAPTPSVCVAIPTFRRPELLEALLDALARQVVPVDWAPVVLVIDNDTQPSVKALVEAKKSGYPFSLEYVHEVRPGLCSVRNRALLYASESFDFLAMIDDDECPEREWLSELLRIQTLTRADAVIGPVVANVPLDAPRWLRVGRFHALPTYPDGASITFGYSGNCLLRVASLARCGVTFDGALNDAGGEDLLFFRQLVARGARLAYAARAVASEAVGPERLSASYVLRRSFRRGNTLSLCDRRLRATAAGLGTRAFKACARLTLGALTLLPLVVTRGRAGGIRALCDIAQGLGSLYGLGGRVYRAYRRDEAAGG